MSNLDGSGEGGKVRDWQPPRLAIIAQSAYHNRIHAWVSLAATNATLGGETHILLTHAALKAFLSDALNEGPVDTGDVEYDRFYQDSLEDERVPNLTELLAQARARGVVKLYGCQASVLLWRRYAPTQLDRLDAIIGHTTFLTLASGMSILTF